MGLGTGIIGGIGASSARLLLGLGCGAQPTNDRDGDSLIDLEDQCPDEPEDRDGFMDSDGCPDIDNDQDGIFDHLDKCPNEPQADGREDGCPYPDPDGDGIEGKADKCPDKPEDKDGFEDEDGCPDLDDDGDGVPDIDDECKNEKEDKDGWADDDGCPDPDNDSDGFADGVDECPDEPESWNGSSDRDGCADGDVVLTISDNEVRLVPPLKFKKNKSKYSKKKAAPALEGLASMLRIRKDITKLSITAKMDIRGKEAKSEKVALKRARAIRKALTNLGVPASRIDVAGEFGDEALSLKLSVRDP
jgi:outer membrane protein OmpA-like peptidoglycan-associated protein